MASKIKKRSLAATQETQTQSAGEHKKQDLHTIIMEGNSQSDKYLKRWWSIVKHPSCRVEYLTTKEIRQIAERPTCKNAIFQSHPSFSQAKKYAYTMGRVMVKQLLMELNDLRNLRKSTYVNR